MATTVPDFIQTFITEHSDVTYGQLLHACSAKFNIGQYELNTVLNVLENQGILRLKPEGGFTPDPLKSRIERIEYQDVTCPLMPFSNRCVVRRDRFKSKSKVAITDGSKKIPTIGTVIAVGDSSFEHLIGKRVLFGRMSGVPVYIAGHPQYDIFDYGELLAIVSGDDKLEFQLEADYESLTSE